MFNRKPSPLIYYPEREGKIAQDVVLQVPNSKKITPRGRDHREFLKDEDLTREIIDGTNKRLEWLNKVLSKDGLDFYDEFSNFEKFDSLTSLHPQLKPIEEMKENLRVYQSRYEKGLMIMTGEGGSGERRK